MNTLKNILYAGCACILMIGCNDFLDLAPLSNSNASNFYQTKSDFDLAVNAAYTTLYTCYGPDGGSSYCGEQMSDNCTMYHVAGNVTDRQAFTNYDLEPSNTIVYLLWQQYYNSLFDINIILDKIDGADLEADYKTSVKAQMQFLRALYYFNMVQLWGDLPIVTRPLTAAESYDVLRSPASDVYDLIIEDLQYSIDNSLLASQVSRPGQVSKGAAQTLLGKVYLILGNKTQAETVLQAVYSSGEYALLDSYADLWDMGNKNSAESIFEIQYIGGTGNPYSVYYPAFAPFENFSITAASGGMNMVTDNLWDEYEADDIRRDLSIDTGYYDADTNFVSIKFPKKWVDNTVVYGSEFCNNNFIVLRYADLLLLLAEATDEESYLNEVRDRAGMPRYGAAGYPAEYNTLALAIEHERRVELALEFHRWFDLKRTDRAIEVLGSATVNKPITPDKLLLPIPTTVIDQNPDITQNPGY